MVYRTDGVIALWLDISFFLQARNNHSYSGLPPVFTDDVLQRESPSTNLLVSAMGLQRFERFMSVQFQATLLLTATLHLQLGHMHSNELQASSSSHSHHCTIGLSDGVFTFIILTGSVAVSSKSQPCQCGRHKRKKRKKRAHGKQLPDASPWIWTALHGKSLNSHICANEMRILYMSVLLFTIAHLHNVLPVNRVKKALEPRQSPGGIPSPNNFLHRPYHAGEQF